MILMYCLLEDWPDLSEVADKKSMLLVQESLEGEDLNIQA